MSEELAQKGLTEHGLIIGNYEFYNIGATTLNQLKKYRIIPEKDYKEYGTRKPDALLVDRRNPERIRVICSIEGKPNEKFDSASKKAAAIQQCNDLCQILEAEIGIATDYATFVWFNPNNSNEKSEYSDITTGTKRSYTLIRDENGIEFNRRFIVDQRTDEPNALELMPNTKLSLENLELVRNNITPSISQISKPICDLDVIQAVPLAFSQIIW